MEVSSLEKEIVRGGITIRETSKFQKGQNARLPHNMVRLGRKMSMLCFRTIQQAATPCTILLKTDTYQNKTIGQAMQMYAPAKDHNDPVAYANALAKHVGVPVDTRVGDLNESQLSGLMDRIGGVEGFTKKGMSTLITPAGGSR